MSRRTDITKEQLEYDFFVEALSVKQVAKKRNCYPNTINRRVKEYSIYLDPEIWGARTSHYVRKLLLQGTKLTPRQVSVLIGCVLGDGYLDGATRNAKLSFEQKISRKGYVAWLRDELHPFVPTKVHKVATKGWGKRLFTIGLEAQSDLDNCIISEGLRQKFKDNNILLSDDTVVDSTNKLKPKAVRSKWLVTDGCAMYIVKRRKDAMSIHSRKTRFCIYMNTVCHPEFTRFRNMFYPAGKKVVPENIGDYLDELSLTVWYEGDGYTDHNNRSSVIYTQSFTVLECRLLLKVLYEKFDVKGSMYPYSIKDNHPILFFGVVASKKLHDIIDPLLHEDFEYKKR